MPGLIDIKYELQAVERALVLAPHPDDETIGCGGTIALYSDKIEFTVVTLSNGEAINIPEADRACLRKKELQDAMEILGVRDIIFLDIPDGKFKEYRARIKEKLTELYIAKKPQMVFSPSPVDLHEDHIETALACIKLAERFPLIRIAFYEVYSPIRFNTLIDIGKVVEIKKTALSKYHYSMLKMNGVFISSVLSLNRFRSLFTLRESYYEAFWIPEAIRDMGDIAFWFTGSVTPPSPEEGLLSNLRVSDSLIQQVRILESESKEKDNLVRSLTFDLIRKDEKIADLREKLHRIESSPFWRFMKIYLKMIEKKRP